MTSVPDRRRMDTLGSFATLKNFPFRVQEKLQVWGRDWFCNHGPYLPGEILTCAVQAKSRISRWDKWHSSTGGELLQSQL